MTTNAMQTLNGSEGSVTMGIGMDKNDIFHLLQNQRRRLVLHVLSETGEIDKSDLATRVAEEEFGNNPSGTERKRVQISLTQTHLDKLQDHGVVEMDHNNVSLGPNAEALVQMILVLEE